MSRPLGLLRRIRYDLWVCRLATLVVGLTAGGFYAIRHWRDSSWVVRGLGPSVDDVALAIAVGVTCWLLISLAIARRRERVQGRVVPGLVLGATECAVLVGAARNGDWPITAPDAVTVFVIGMLGSVGVLIVPGSLRENPWSRRKPERN